ncbi:hypothetical protein SDC9_167386 [bioreactor metagenome]|uniref:Uncharacterized protein n=1 Tax=bioreactor metagenome TaxID=1076179 RepID=A0A645G285_9ZZZZ
MKKFLRLLKHVIPHLTIMFGGMFVVFYVIDTMNKAMEFLTSDLSKKCILVLALLSIATAAILIHQTRWIALLRSKKKTTPPK